MKTPKTIKQIPCGNKWQVSFFDGKLTRYFPTKKEAERYGKLSGMLSFIVKKITK